MNSWYKFADCHAGETGIVIGNGPSLNDIPVSFLQRYPSFGTNRIYLLHGFTPTYYVCVTPLVVEQYAPEIWGVQCKQKFITEKRSAMVRGSLPLYSSNVPCFSRTPNVFVYEGYTVTYVCLQLAFWMGFKTVLLVGVDHAYQFQGQPNEEHRLDGPDVNHFSSGYFSGARWNNPDLSQSERAYKMARTVFESAGRGIINCSTRTALDVFPRADWKAYDGS